MAFVESDTFYNNSELFILFSYKKLLYRYNVFAQNSNTDDINWLF